MVGKEEKEKYDKLIQAAEMKVKEVVLKISNAYEKTESDDDTVVASPWQAVQRRKWKAQKNRTKSIEHDLNAGTKLSGEVTKQNKKEKEKKILKSNKLQQKTYNSGKEYSTKHDTR